MSATPQMTISGQPQQRDMRRDAVGPFLILNHEILATGKTDVFDRIRNAAVYEVIRVVEGVPLFFEEHMERMRQSGDASGIAVRKEDSEVLEEISTLVEQNQCPETNAKLVCSLLEHSSHIAIANKNDFCIRTHSKYPRDSFEK